MGVQVGEAKKNVRVGDEVPRHKVHTSAQIRERERINAIAILTIFQQRLDYHDGGASSDGKNTLVHMKGGDGDEMQHIKGYTRHHQSLQHAIAV